MARLLFYVSGHGYGHATRIRAVIAALRARAPFPLEIRVRTEAPHWIFTERDADVVCETARVDAGVIQPDSLEPDLEASLEAHEAFARDWPEILEREVAAIRDAGASLVVGDIPPLAFAAAARAGVPSVGIANFSWDWICAAYADTDPRWHPHVARYREAYATVDTLFRLPFSGDFGAFPQIVDAPLLVNRSTRSREACRQAVDVEGRDDRRLVLVSFGGAGAAPAAGGSDEDLSAYVFVGFGDAMDSLPGEWRTLRHPSPIPHEDLMRACDAIIGKPGYGTVAEAVTHGTRFLHLPRPGFREVPVLAAGLARYGGGRAMPREDYAAGRWRAHLDALFEQPPPAAPIATNGAEFLADALLKRLGPA